MTVPSKRLIWLAALVALPLATVAGMATGFIAVASTILGLCVLVAAADSVLGARRAARFQLRAPAVLRLTKDVETTVPLVLENRSGSPAAVRLALAIPEGITSTRTVEHV